MNKKTEPKKKLELKRETVRALTGTEMQNIAGGGYNKSDALYICSHRGLNPQ